MFYNEDISLLSIHNFKLLPTYVRFAEVVVPFTHRDLTYEGTEIDQIALTRVHHLPLLQQMKANLIGSTLYFAFKVDSEIISSILLAYLNNELVPLFTSRIPNISIDICYLDNYSSGFGEQFLLPFLNLQQILRTSTLYTSINYNLDKSYFCFAFPFDPIFKWLHFNDTTCALKKCREFSLEIYSEETDVPLSFLNELEALGTRIISVKKQFKFNDFLKFKLFMLKCLSA